MIINHSFLLLLLLQDLGLSLDVVKAAGEFEKSAMLCDIPPRSLLGDKDNNEPPIGFLNRSVFDVTYGYKDTI